MFNRSFFILVTNNSAKQQHANKRKIPGRLIYYISTTVSTEATQKSSHDEQSLPSVVQNIKTEEESSPSMSRNQKLKDWNKSIVILRKYSQYKDKFTDKLTPFQQL